MCDLFVWPFLMWCTEILRVFVPFFYKLGECLNKGVTYIYVRLACMSWWSIRSILRHIPAHCISIQYNGDVSMHYSLPFRPIGMRQIVMLLCFCKLRNVSLLWIVCNQINHKTYFKICNFLFYFILVCSTWYTPLHSLCTACTHIHIGNSLFAKQLNKV